MVYLLLSRRPGRDEEKKNEERTGAKKKGNFAGQNKNIHIYSYFCGKLTINCRCKKILVTNQNMYFLFIFQ